VWKVAETLLVGTDEVDITPAVGTALAGSFPPRTSVGVEDPLCIKAIVLESAGTKLAYVILDLIGLSRTEGDKAVALASQRTGIPQQNIVWAASHTHTGPYAVPMFGEANQDWLASIPHELAECVSKADVSKVPARMSRLRGYHVGLSHNRRLRFKDGREINTWLLEHGEEDVQCVGSAGPTDPEIGILAFEDEEERLISVLFQSALHTNANFGEYFSADYPAVVASRLRERFGTQVSTLFVPGAFGDLNPTQSGAFGDLDPAGDSYRHVGDALAEVIIEKLDRRRSSEAIVHLGAMKREAAVPYRDFSVDQESRIKAAQYPAEDQEVFRGELEIMRKEGVSEAKTVLQAWHVGDVGFASLPGELFVEWGLKIKRESPFPWTYPVGLGGDYLGYLVTHQAWEAGGYESLIARTARPTPDGVGQMVNTALEMLKELYSAFERKIRKE